MQYVANILPPFMVKLCGPYFFHRISYCSRVLFCMLLMVVSFLTVAFGSDQLSLQLLGVACSGLQSGLGEASFLALTSFYHSKETITCWSSGTGFAGVAGYAFVNVMVLYLKYTFKEMLLVGLLFPLGLGVVYFKVLPQRRQVKYKTIMETTDKIGIKPLVKYMIPLMIVYFAEYTMQAGTWAAIGFPVADKSARDRFYSYAGWAYQVGVFISRSSGTILQANYKVLVLMPILQIGFLGFFVIVAAYQVFYSWVLLFPCFLVGLLGGGVYVNAFTLLSMEIPPNVLEFALSTVSIADTMGIIGADVAGLYVQACLYSKNSIPGAKVQC